MSREQHTGIPALSDHVRSEIGRHIVRDLLNEQGRMPTIVLEPALEHEIATLIPALPPNALAALIVLLKQAVEAVEGKANQNQIPILVGNKRREFQNIIKRSLPQLQVMDYAEVPNDILIDALHIIRKTAFDQRLKETGNRFDDQDIADQPDA